MDATPPRVLQYLRRQQYAAAVAEIGLEPVPKVRGLLLLRARLHTLTGSFGAAADDFERLGGRLGRERAKHARSLGRQLDRLERELLASDCDDVIDRLDRLLRVARAAPTLYQRRGECQLSLGQLRAAHSDASLTVALDPHAPAGLLLLSRTLYQSAGLDSNRTAHVARRCVRVAPDHVGCSRFLRFLRKVDETLAAAAAGEAAGDLEAAATAWERACEIHGEGGRGTVRRDRSDGDSDSDSDNDADDADDADEVGGGSGRAGGGHGAPPLPLLVRRRAYLGLCRVERARDNVSGVLAWCPLLAALHGEGETDPLQRAEAARAHVFSGWAQHSRASRAWQVEHGK